MKAAGVASGGLLVLVLAACSAKSQREATAPSPRSDAVGDGAGADASEKAAAAEEAAPAEAEPEEDLEALHDRVDEAWAELEALQAAEQRAATTPDANPDVTVARCKRIRGLATEICGLSDRMCMLATQHPGQSRYGRACARSQETCGRASHAAERCIAR
jgi:hypothetical protein